MDVTGAPENRTDGDFLDHALNIHSGLRSIIGAGHARGWMMLAGQPGNDALEARRARFDPPTRGEAAISRVSTTASGEHQPELSGWIDRTTASRAPPPRTHEIKIDESHRILVASGSRDRLGVRAGLILAALAASIGLASIGMLNGNFLVGPDTAASTAPMQSPTPPAGIANATKGDRLPIHRTIARGADREAPAKSPHGPKPLSSTAIARSKASSAAGPPTASADNHPTPAQSPAPSMTESAAGPHTETPLTPVPETRPTTIDGWTVREVVDGTAVLEGPDGILRVKRGDTVPGVGRIVGILRWGNRLIVATSKGLVSTR
jgi:hypothetical protein